MLRLFANAKYDFISVRRYAYAVTALFILPGLLLLLARGLNYSVEFTGGTLIQVESKGKVDVGVVRAGLDREGIHGAEIQNYGAPNEFVVRARVAKPGTDANDTQATADAVHAALVNVLGADNVTVKRTEAVGPKVGGELRTKAFLAIFLSFFAVLAYLAYRVEWRFGLASVLATAHDIVATVAFIAMLHLEVRLTVVAAVLSMVGYSLNDTIIIFDRVRENPKKHKKESFEQILNRSINETLPRSVLTHGTTLSSLIALIVFGGEVIRPFALVMFFGVFTGTFSSIYIASPVLMAIEKRWPGQLAKGHLTPQAASPERPVPGGGRKTAPVG
jgi:preprotein translocase subunit SecF